MKNLVLLLLLFPLSAAAQENLMRTDTTFHPNGKMAVIETKDVSLNVRSGWYQVYDSCGQLLVSGTFAPATKVLCSYCHQWDEIYDKFIVTDSVEVAEMRIGRWSYYYPNGQLKEPAGTAIAPLKASKGISPTRKWMKKHISNLQTRALPIVSGSTAKAGGPCSTNAEDSQAVNSTPME